MSYEFDERRSPRKQLILFLVGGLIFIACLFVATDLNEYIKIPALELVRYAGLVGLILQIFAVARLRQFSNKYVGSIVCIILDIILAAGYITLYIIDKYTSAVIPQCAMIMEALNIAMIVAESFIMIFFALGTNQLARDYYNSMDLLTKLVVIVFLIFTLGELLFGILGLAGVTLPDIFILRALYKIVNIASVAKHILVLIFIIVAIVRVTD